MTRLIETAEEVGFRAQIEAGIARVTLLDRRMSWRMLTALAELPGHCHDAGARGILLRSEHSDFCHGIDLADPDILGRVQADGGASIAEMGAEMVRRWINTPLPTVAVLSNWTIGAGACLAMACDFRVAMPLTRISFPEVDRGMHLSWGIIPRLIHECGAPLTRRMTMLGDPVSVEEFPAEVFAISPEAERVAQDLIGVLAVKPASALQAIKMSIAGQTAATPTYLERDVERFTASISSQGFLDAMAAWFESRGD